jgi:hypothetical protein
MKVRLTYNIAWDMRSSARLGSIPRVQTRVQSIALRRNIMSSDWDGPFSLVLIVGGVIVVLIALGGVAVGWLLSKLF